jgi:hypothetical protein
MSKTDSNAASSAGKTQKSNKPYPDFLMFPHAAGVWAKKIRGKLHYFGPWDDPDGTLKKYLAEKDALHAGRKPREDTDGATVNDLCNRFLNAKQALVDSGERTRRSWKDYKGVRTGCLSRSSASRAWSQTSTRTTSASCGSRWSRRLGDRSRSGTSFNASGWRSSSPSTTTHRPAGEVRTEPAHGARLRHPAPPFCAVADEAKDRPSPRGGFSDA